MNGCAYTRKPVGRIERDAPLNCTHTSMHGGQHKAHVCRAVVHAVLERALPASRQCNAHEKLSKAICTARPAGLFFFFVLLPRQWALKLAHQFAWRRPTLNSVNANTHANVGAGGGVHGYRYRHEPITDILYIFVYYLNCVQCNQPLLLLLLLNKLRQNSPICVHLWVLLLLVVVVFLVCKIVIKWNTNTVCALLL